jgi:hypothetical protein
VIEEPPFEDEDDAAVVNGSPAPKLATLQIKSNKVQPILENNQSFMQTQ